MDHVPLEGGFDDEDGDVEDEGPCEHASVPEEDVLIPGTSLVLKQILLVTTEQSMRLLAITQMEQMMSWTQISQHCQLLMVI